MHHPDYHAEEATGKMIWIDYSVLKLLSSHFGGHMDKSIYFDIHPILTYNALINFIIGERGVGKTYGCKKFCIADFIKNGNKKGSYTLLELFGMPFEKEAK